MRQHTPQAQLTLVSLSAAAFVAQAFDGFVSCWDARTRNPRWVAERLTAASVRGEGERKGVPFTEDAALPPRFRARLDDYKGSGLDRGHLAAAANHKGTQGAMSSTFTLSNVSPQVGKGFNRDYWARLEKFVRDLTKKYDDVYVVTGPLFLPRPLPVVASGAAADAAPNGAAAWFAAWPHIGRPPRLVAVPTHFFKVIYAQGSSSNGADRTVLGAFVLPNAPLPAGEPLSRFAVPLEALEAAAGLCFYEGALGRDGAREAFAEQEARWRAALPAAHGSAWHAHAPLLLEGGAAAQQAQQAALPAPPPRKALPPPEGSAIVVAPPAQEAPLVALPRRAGVPSPLCSVEACRLPAEAWWTASGNGDGAAANGNGAADAGNGDA
jgi:endonuclease G